MLYPCSMYRYTFKRLLLLLLLCIRNHAFGFDKNTRCMIYFMLSCDHVMDMFRIKQVVTFNMIMFYHVKGLKAGYICLNILYICKCVHSCRPCCTLLLYLVVDNSWDRVGLSSVGSNIILFGGRGRQVM